MAKSCRFSNASSLVLKSIARPSVAPAREGERARSPAVRDRRLSEGGEGRRLDRDVVPFVRLAGLPKEEHAGGGEVQVPVPEESDGYVYGRIKQITHINQMDANYK